MLLLWEQKGAERHRVLQTLRQLCSDLGTGLGVYFNMTPPFLIIVPILKQTGKSSCEFIFYFSGHTFWKKKKILKIPRGNFLLHLIYLFLKQLLYFELQGLTAVLVLLGDFFTMWINQCYELGPWGFGNVIGFRWHFASQSAKQPNVDTAEQFQLFPLAPSSFPGRYILFLYFVCPLSLWLS